MRVIRDQRGFTAMELLVASTIFIVVLTAILVPFDGFLRTTKRTEQQNAAQDMARETVDRLVTDLRSAGSSTQLVERAAATDIVFKMADPLTNPSGANTGNEKRVRYCLSGTNLFRQEQTWSTASPPALPALTSCPDGALVPAAGRLVAADVVNGATPLFLYDTATIASIRQIQIDVLVDVNPGATPKTSELKTAVTLRNAN